MRVFIFIVLITFPLFNAYAEGSCVTCHGSEKQMTDLGYPQLYLDITEVNKEVNMGGISCESCHLGDSGSMDKDAAHKDMPRPYYAAIGANNKYQAVDRSITGYDPIKPKGNSRVTLLMRKADPKTAEEKGIKKLAQLFYHDHDPETMAYSPDIAMQTCGQCHEKEVNEYSQSGMGLNKYQKGYQTFTDMLPGPQNCGAWFGINHELINEQDLRENVTLTEKMAHGLNRGCNKCHASCTDCHYQGYAESEARHTFVKSPGNLSCYGSGKGEICHAGPMDRRRGAGYIREEYAFPVNELPRDVHDINGMECVDCHKMQDHDYGHLASKQAVESCGDCHTEIYEAAYNGDHRNVDCGSCHIQEIGAYQFTFWGPGKSEGQNSVLSKHKEYYGTRSLPLIVKHPATGVWIPLKPYPMGVMNIKKQKVTTGKLLPRAINKTTVSGNTAIGEADSFYVERGADQVNDMYIMAGIFSGFKNADNILAWIQMDKLSHSIGKARDCGSCHSGHEQKVTSWYTYNNQNDVKQPFYGSYTVTADKNGIRFENFTNSEVVPLEGVELEFFAPFLLNNQIWNIKGIDFEMKYDDKSYASSNGEYLELYAELHNLISKETDEAKKTELKLIKSILPHNIAEAKKRLGH